jgi:predicted nucleotide-binding protein
MSTIYEELFLIADRLEPTLNASKQGKLFSPVSSIEKASEKASKAWSGSWLGYHSKVYYQDLKPTPPGARFSQEWGFMKTSFVRETVGDWVEYDFDDVQNMILAHAGNPELSSVEEFATQASTLYDDCRHEVISLLSTYLDSREDSFLRKLKEDAENIKVFAVNTIISACKPSGKFMSRDTTAIGQGLLTPPHIALFASMAALRSPRKACDELEKVARRAASHISKQERHAKKQEEIGTNVFIGHGRSHCWKDLKDFIQDRLSLPWDEFNRIPVAGVTNIARLSQMLDDSAIAFLVMTAEDEQADGTLNARMNVVHEAGLFQGKLGFTKAILLLEEGCEEFSNVQGLGQIRFPKGNIKAAFEEIRQVIEREGLIDS